MYNTLDIGVYTEMGSSRTDLNCTIFPEAVDHFDRMPDSLIVVVFNKIADVKALGRCGVVSRRFNSLVSQVENVVVPVDRVISADDYFSSSAAVDYKTYNSFCSLFTLFIYCLIQYLDSFTQFFANSRRRADACSPPIQVLKNFNEIKSLRIELPSGELGIDEGVLLRWRIDFGSTLDYCVILGASSLVTPPVTTPNYADGSIPESFYVSGDMKWRVVSTISSMIAAYARRYLLMPIISDHKALDSLILSDGDGQGVLCVRVKPVTASKILPVELPALSMLLWYAPRLELPDGTVLKGATLVAIRPSEVPRKDVFGSDGNRLASAFEEPYGTAARMLVKGRTFLEMNSF